MLVAFAVVSCGQGILDHEPEGEIFFLMGGMISDGTATNQVLRSLDGETWEAWGELPFSRFCGRAARFQGRIWYAGGRDAVQNAYDTVWSSADGKTWRTEGSLTTARAGHALIAAGGVLYAAGGHDAAPSPLASMDLTTGGAWSPSASAATNRVFGVGFTLSGVPVIAGGESILGGGAMASAEIFNSVWSTWSAADQALAAARTHAAWADFGESAWVIGGLDGSDVVRRSVIEYKSGGSTDLGNLLPIALKDAAAIVSGSAVWVAGGLVSIASSVRQEVYRSTGSGSFKKVGELPSARACAALATLPN
ncbi:MAG: hypothetical protein IT285_04910 [Bdellovibrionales bacterium]|nr:hypothetical protein [Bdellovibrionales bacterium]